jgi:hypothetical protein
MKQTIIGSLSPIAQAKAKGLKATISGSADMYGACSLEHFSSAGGLSLTHEDAKGWLDYVTQFTPGNFWYKDAGVQVWKYEETYDNWQDTYGADAVVAFYHSGHGNMDSNGVFQAPLGSKWDNRDWAFSNRMNLGNETVRYLFWSTCFSLRVFAPHNPIRTWHPVNKGLRMVFGFETTSVDNANYGKNFWNIYKQVAAGKPFSTCWLDASWQISHNQAPSVMATGNTAAEAQTRLFNENKFYSGAGSRNYYHWRWYNAARAANLARTALSGLPKHARIALLSGDKDDLAEAKKIAKTLGITQKNAGNVMMDKDGSTIIRDTKRQITLDKYGQINAETGMHNYKNTDLIDQQEAISIAEGVITDCGLNKKADLQLENIIHGCSCSGSSKGSGKIGEEAVTETIVQFRQVIDGLPAINAGNGLVRVSIDNDGNVISMINSIKKVDELSSKAKGSFAPKPKSRTAVQSFGATSEADLEKKFQQELSRLTMHAANGNGHSNGTAKATKEKGNRIIEDKIGYNLNGGIGSVVAHREYEVDLGRGLKKRYKVRVPIVV